MRGVRLHGVEDSTRNDMRRRLRLIRDLSLEEGLRDRLVVLKHLDHPTLALLTSGADLWVNTLVSGIGRHPAFLSRLP